MAKALAEESGLFCLVEIETARETVMVAVPMTSETRGRARAPSVEWAKEIYLEKKRDTEIIRAQLKRSREPIIL
jgi:hypothetical protein